MDNHQNVIVIQHRPLRKHQKSKYFNRNSRSGDCGMAALVYITVFLLCATIFFRSKTPLFLSLRIAEFIFLSQTFRFEAELQGGVAQSMASLD